MKYVIRNIGIGTYEFLEICDYVEKNINRENLYVNGGTLNYSNLTYNSDILLIAFNKDIPIGYNSVIKCNGGYYIYQIAVKKEFQNMGIGTEMLRVIVNMANNQDVSVLAHVMSYNEPSLKMFNSFGFKRIDERSKNGNNFLVLNQKVKKL